ncbi:hypothetical protein [Spirillospora sp. NPDC048819]|uniref:hypothetical protein n=1 Tax=Spirillospora sp. NPDC048819 TaxID=3155268 RepID=UPI00340B0F8E
MDVDSAGGVSTGFEPVYLHFLDSQLINSVARFPRPDDLAHVFAVAAVFRGGPFYCSLSALWESPLARQGPLAELIRIAAETGWLVAYSGFESTEEFIQSRHELYAHAWTRYPMYFSATARPAYTPDVQVKLSDTSAALQRGTLNHLHGSPGRLIPRAEVLESPRIQRKIERILRNRGNRAMTAPLFDDLRDAGPAGYLAQKHLTKVMSANYLRDYVAAGTGVILTGIHGLSLFEGSFTEGFPGSDAPVLNTLAKMLNMNVPYNVETSRWWYRFFEAKHAPLHAEFVGRTGMLLRHCAAAPVAASLPARRSATMGILRRSFYGLPQNTCRGDPDIDLAAALNRLEKAEQRAQRIGVLQMSTSEHSAPDETQPPAIVFHGNVSGSSFVLSGRDSNIGQVGIEAQRVRDFTEQLRDNLDEVARESGEGARVAQELATVEAHLNGAEVPAGRAQASLEYLRAVVLGVAGNAAFTGLVELAQNIG